MLCNRIRIASTLLCCFFLCISPTANAQEAPIAFAANGNPFRQIVEQRVQAELNCMKLVANLTDEQADTILDKLDDLIEEESAGIMQAIQNGNTSAATGDSKAIRDAIAVESKSVLGAKDLKAFNQDLALRLKFQRLSLIHI